MRARALYVAWNVPLTLALCCMLVAVGVPQPLGAAVVVAPRQVPAIDAAFADDPIGLSEIGDATLSVAPAVFVDSFGEGGFANSTAMATTCSGFAGSGRPEDLSTLRDPWACLECAAQLGALGLTVVGMVAACGGPSMGWACVEAYLGATIQEVSALVSCYRCLADEPPDGGDDERDDEDEDEDEDEDDDECTCTGIGLCDCL